MTDRSTQRMEAKPAHLWVFWGEFRVSNSVAVPAAAVILLPYVQGVSLKPSGNYLPPALTITNCAL